MKYGILGLVLALSACASPRSADPKTAACQERADYAAKHASTGQVLAAGGFGLGLLGAAIADSADNPATAAGRDAIIAKCMSEK